MKEHHRERPCLRGLEETIDDAGMDSFPASDPPSWSATHVGTPDPVRGGPEMFHDVVQRIRDDVRLLSETIGERNDRSPRALMNLDRAAEAIERRFHDARLPVKRRRANEVAWNIEAVVRGERLAGETIVVAAHYDCPQGSPGADDNASGVAILLALAHSLQALRLDRTVRLVALAAEEPPHAGTERMSSARYLDDLRREGTHGLVGRGQAGPQVRAMVSLEALGVYGRDERRWPFRLVRLLRADLALVGDRRARSLVERAKRAFDEAESDVVIAAVTYPLILTTVRSQTHYVFAREGIPSFMVTDTAPLWSLDYHRANDTADRLDYERLGSTSVALARVVTELAGRASAAV
jgi:hypothetical protein